MDMTNVSRLLAGVGRRLLPSCCLVCRHSGARDIDLCAACAACLPVFAVSGQRIDECSDTPLWCLGCGEPWRGSGVANRTRLASPTVRGTAYLDRAGRAWCATCAHRRSPFRRQVSVWRYAYPLDGLLADLKHRGRRPVASALAALLAIEVRRVITCDDLSPAWPDVLVPVPDATERLRARGFSPVEDIATALGQRLSLPVRSDWALRVDDTGSQTLRSRAERALAIQGAFRVSDHLYGQRVAIVDDVLTTGATSRELARECLDAGVASLELWTLARTVSADHHWSRQGLG